jgi:uroporphyrinogen-III synthase
MRLQGKRVVNTRAAHQAAALDSLLQAEGAIPLDYPVIAIAPPQDTQVLDAALAGEYDLLVLTSTNTVKSLRERVNVLGLSLQGVRAAAVGEATAQVAQEKLGAEIVFVPEQPNANTLAQTMPMTPGMRILLPQSEIARPKLAETLRGRGAVVTAVTAYRTVRGHGGVQLAPLLSEGLVDAVTFTSASTVRYFAERLHDEGADMPDNIVIACLSAQISAAAHEEGYTRIAESKISTLTWLIEALVGAFN